MSLKKRTNGIDDYYSAKDVQEAVKELRNKLNKISGNRIFEVNKIINGIFGKGE